MTPKTCWVGGSHPCNQSAYGMPAFRAAPTQLKDRLFEAVVRHPGWTSRELHQLPLIGVCTIKAVNSALSRLESAGAVFSTRRVESIEGTPGRYWVQRWHPKATS